MKKNKETFAARAKKIMQKYSRHEWDALERKDMEKELRALRDEQEAMRETMGIIEGSNKMDEMEQFADGGPAKVYTGNLKMPTYKDMVAASNFKSPIKGEQFRPIQTSATPYIVSAAASMLGDLGSLASMYKTRPDTLNLPRVAPTKVNLQPERETATRAYNTNRNVALRYSRDMSNPANAYANQMAGLSSLQGSYGDIMGKSYMNEANANAQLQQQTNLTNAQYAAEEAKANLQLKTQLSDTQSGLINSISETIPKALRDYRSDYSQNMMMNIMGKDYGLYEPIPQFKNSWERFMYNMKGPQYRILNRQYANQNLGQ